MGRPLWRAPFWSLRDLLAKLNHLDMDGKMRPINLNSAEGLRPQMRQIVDALCRGKRSTASTLLLDLGHGTPSLRVQDFVDVLNYCATSPDPLITLEHGNFDDALNLLDKMSSEDIQVDRVLYNTILRTARWKGRIDIIELILGQMHRAKILPDPSTCYYVFSAYVGRGFHNTAVEALQVLTMRMICQEETALQELKEKFEEDFIFNEDAEADLPILELFEESEELVFALLSLRWCAILGFPISWSPDESQWERRRSANYDRTQTTALIGA